MKTNCLIYTGLALVLTVSCSDGEKMKESDNSQNIGIFASTRAEEDGDVVYGSNSITDILEDSFENDFSIIYISQRGPNNVNPEFDNPNSENLYTYVYYDNPSANWEGGYNFSSLGAKELDWENISSIGMIGSSYIFYSMYFPEDNKVRFEVEENQSTLSNLRKSNILGARHTTADLNSRLRFRFYHLMVFMNVTLYVPVYDETDNSGFLENALDGGTAININRHFYVDYASNPGADASPTVSLTGIELNDIQMYVHPGFEETEINVADYYPWGDKETDRVRKYTLSVIFPAGQDITDRDLLRFALHMPGGTVKKYVFSTLQNIQLLLDKGAVTQLALYLPRKENNTILINAEIIDWSNSSSEMNIVEE